MRRIGTVGSALALLFVTVTPQAQTGGDLAARLGYPDYVLYNGKIVTVDDASFSPSPGTIHQALAVRGDSILATGTTVSIRALAGPDTRLIDLKGRTVLPSLMLTHEHPTDWAWTHPEGFKHVMPPGSDVFGNVLIRFLTGSAQEQLASWQPALKEMVAKAKPGQWIWISTQLGANFEHAEELFAKFTDTVTRERIDAIAPDNPVRVKNGWPLSSVENSKAMAEVKRLFPNVDLEEGEAGPRFIEPDVIMHGDTENLARLLKSEMELWVAHGVTFFGSSPYNLHNLEALQLLDSRGEMPARFGYGFYGPDLHEDTLRFMASRTGTGSDYLWQIGARAGSGGSCSTIEAAPAIKAKERCSYAPGSPDRETLERLIRTGNRLATLHSYADKDIDYLLDIIEKASKDGGFSIEEVRAKRHAFDHAMGAPRPDQLPRIKNLGMMVSMINTVIWENRTDYDASFRARDYGIEYTKYSVPRKSVAGAQIMNTQEIDRPLPHKIFYNVWAGMTRYNEGRRQFYTPGEGTDRITQLKALTTWGSYYTLREKKLGSLQPGKWADLIILDRDFLTVPEREIPTIKVLLTMVGGRVLHLRPELAAEAGMSPVGPVAWPTKPLEKYYVVPELQLPASLQ